MKRTLAALLTLLLLFTACGRVELRTAETTAAPEPYATTETPATTAAPTQAETEITTETTTEIPQTTAVTCTAAVTEMQTVIVSVSYAPATTEAPVTAVTATAAPTTAKTPPTTAAPKTTVPATTAPKTTAPPTTQKPNNTCTVRIECKTIQNNLKKLKAGKAAFVPQSGVILADAAVELQPGDTAFTVLQRACKENVCTDNCKYCKNGGIQIEYTYTPGFNTYYVEGIHQIYEKDCGAMSGWMFSLNGTFPEVGASSVSVSPGDRIVFAYTCDMGDDIGNHFEG